MRILPFLAAAVLAACRPYSLDLQQGNVISPDAVARLRAGMTRQQVGFVLGTPLIKDAFHADRWDYAYYVRKKGQYKDFQKLSVVFENDRLARVEGDLAPATLARQAASNEGDASPAAEPAAAKPGPVDPAPATRGGDSLQLKPSTSVTPPAGTKEGEKTK